VFEVHSVLNAFVLLLCKDGVSELWLTSNVEAIRQVNIETLVI